MNQKNKKIKNNENFYTLYKSLDKKVKKYLRKKMSKNCRVTEKTINDWLTKQSIPIYQSNRVTKIVFDMATKTIIEINPISITEKKLFPFYALDLLAYE